jgi:hypothetical protein
LAVRRQAHGLAEGQRCPAVTILGADPLEPGAIGPAEVPEPARGTIEGCLEESEVPPRAFRHRWPAKLALVEEIDLQRSRDVVRAVAMGWIRSGPDRVLHDADLVTEGIEVAATNWMERQDFRHRWPPASLLAP